MPKLSPPEPRVLFDYDARLVNSMDVGIFLFDSKNEARSYLRLTAQEYLYPVPHVEPDTRVDHDARALRWKQRLDFPVNPSR